MFGRRFFVITAMLAFTGSFSAAVAAQRPEWNGVWIGTSSAASKISVTIAHNKVTNYSYAGAKLNVSYDKMSDGAFSFGDRDNYSVSLIRTGDHKVKAIYHGRHGFVSAALTRQ